MSQTTESRLNPVAKQVHEFLALADIQINGQRPWDIQVHDPRFYARVLRGGSLGLGESYMEGWWDSQALDQTFFKILRAKLSQRIKPNLSIALNLLKAKLFNPQDRKKCKVVIDQHYQLGNDLYPNMLDSTMAYTCAYWDQASTLEEAQIAKYDLVARKLKLEKGMKVLDIGCGWGGFCKHIATHYGVQAVGVNLSENQVAHARKVNQGLPVEIRLQDYRDVVGKFDRIASIGIMEHVGYKNYRCFMQKMYDHLVDQGLAFFHTIASDDDLPVAEPWTNKYIFPGGSLPSISAIGKAIEGLFVMEDWHNLSVNYDKTLLAWFENFNRNWPKIESHYSPQFYRMWKYYLLSYAGGFRARSLELWQVVLSKDGILGGYKSVR